MGDFCWGLVVDIITWQEHKEKWKAGACRQVNSLLDDNLLSMFLIQSHELKSLPRDLFQPLKKDTEPFMRVKLSWPWHLLKALPSLNNITLGINFSMSVGGYKPQQRPTVLKVVSLIFSHILWLVISVTTKHQPSPPFRRSKLCPPSLILLDTVPTFTALRWTRRLHLNLTSTYSRGKWTARCPEQVLWTQTLLE